MERPAPLFTAEDTLGIDEPVGQVRDVAVQLSPTVWQFVMATEEVVLLFGPRREGKTTGGVAAMLYHAERNACTKDRPLRAAVVRDTWTNLERTVIDTLRQGQKRGWWWAQWLADGTQAVLNGVVHLYFFGMDRTPDANKFQSFEAGLIWIEEPAPAADLASGVPVDVFGMGVSSLSQPGVHPRVQITMNPPDEDHWTMEVSALLAEMERPELRVRTLFIPAGENRYLEEGYRERLRLGFEVAGRMDLVARLAEGKVGSVKMGEAVTPEFSDSAHIYREEGTAAAIPWSPRWPGFRFWDFGLCVDRETEILTDAGWKRFAHLDGTERVATRSHATSAFEWQRPTAYVRQPFAGDLVCYRSQNVDFAVTPEHRLPVWRERGRDGSRQFEFVAAGTLATYANPHAAVDLTATWSGSDAGLYGPLKWGAVLFARFAGWYLAEGTASPRGLVTIYQTRPHPLLARVLADTGLPWRERRHRGDLVGWGVWSPALAAYLRALGTARDKHAPRELFGLTRESIGAFLESFIAGDGHARCRTNGAWEFTAFTASPRLADDLQTLALLAGSSARITRRAPSVRTIRDRGRRAHVARSVGGFVVAFKRKAARSHLYGRHVTLRPYTGEVYCVTVPNGVIYVRRNGIAHWTGNSPTCIWSQLTPMGNLHVLGCAVGENMGIQELIEQVVLPWQAAFGMNPPHSTLGGGFGRGAKPGMLRWRDIGDPAAKIREQSSSERSAKWTLQSMLRTAFEEGPVEWPARRDAVKANLNRMVGGRAFIQIDESECKPLLKALRGGWRYGKLPNGKLTPQPIKDRHSHPGDAFGYGLAVLFPPHRLVQPPPLPRPPSTLPPAHSFLGR